ncbi:MAG: hypothetical protein QMC40_08045 [Vicingaceae bacterium]|jgi:hypothetical protein
MNRVTTKVQDLETLRQAQTELKERATTQQTNLTAQVRQLKSNIFGKPENTEPGFDLPQRIESILLKTIMNKVFKPKSKLGSTVTNIVSNFIVQLYGKKIQKKIFKLTNRFLAK